MRGWKIIKWPIIMPSGKANDPLHFLGEWGIMDTKQMIPFWDPEETEHDNQNKKKKKSE